MKYYLRKEEEMALRAMEARRGLRVLILEGPPGTGKTAFSEFLAERWGAQYLYFLCHHWVTEEEVSVPLRGKGRDQRDPLHRRRQGRQP